MKIINRILILFFALAMLTLFAGWRILHSERFSKEASLRISKILAQNFGAVLSFSKVEFSLFPLETTLLNVKISKEDPSQFLLNLELDELSVSFSYASFLSNEFEVERISLNNGRVNLNLLSTNNDKIDWATLSLSTVFQDYLDYSKKIPLRLNFISINNVEMNVDENSFNVKSFVLSPHRKQIRLKTELSNIVIARDNDSDYLIPKIERLKLQAKFDKNELNFDELKLEKKSTKLGVKGRVYNNKKRLILDSQVSSNINLKEFHEDFKLLPQPFNEITGDIELVSFVEGELFQPNLKLVFSGRNIVTPWVNLEQVSGELKKNASLISLTKLNAINNKENYSLTRESAFYNLAAHTFTNFNFKMKVKNAKTSTFLKYVPTLQDLDAALSGDLEINLFDDKAVFKLANSTKFEYLNLLNKKNKIPTLKIPSFIMNESLITIREDNGVEIDSQIVEGLGKINLKGQITDKGIDIKTKNSTVDFKSLGPIAGVDIVGVGPLELEVSGPLDDVLFNAYVDLENFNAIDLYLGKLKSNLEFSLKDLALQFNSIEGTYKDSIYKASGSIKFEDESPLDLKVELLQTNLKDTQNMYRLIFSKFKIPLDPALDYSGKFQINGGFDLDKLSVLGDIRGENLQVAGETIDKISMQLTLDKSQLNFKQIKMLKSRGELFGKLNYNIPSQYLEVEIGSKLFRLQDFNFYRNTNMNYDGDIVADFSGAGTIDSVISKLKIKVQNAYIQNNPAASSNAVFYFNPNETIINASLLEGKLKVDSSISKKSDIASLKAELDTKDLRELLGIIAVHNVGDKEITGRAKAQLATTLNVANGKLEKFFLNIENLNFKKGEINLAIDPKYNKISLENSVIKNWDLRFTDGDGFFVSKGRNLANNNLGIENTFNIKAAAIGVFTDSVESASGYIKGNNLITFDKKLIIKDFTIYGDNNSLKIKNLPGLFNDLDFTIVKRNGFFEVTRFSGKYGGGDFKIGGSLKFDTTYSDLNLDYKIDKVNLSLFKKSTALISAMGNLKGKEVPYKLSGKVSILHAEILDDPADLNKESKSNIDEFQKYLPSKSLLGRKSAIDTSINFEIINPVVVRNNLTEVFIRGNGGVTGDPMSPELNTRLEIVPGVSKFKFKGHDFALNQGYVEIRDKGKNRFSDLKFTGLSRINDYDMKLDLSGTISKVNIDLSSEPALSKEDLLSLLTLGVTSDMSKNLEAGERRFVTTVGIGTLLVDQLKINEDLNSTLGLKLSVQPEFKEDESTLIQGKSAVSDTGSSRLKSATKIKINKKINKRVDVSVSSTVGGSLEQKQEMNINLNINKNFSLEGVYELKPAEDENTNTPTSVGADLKYRWSF